MHIFNVSIPGYLDYRNERIQQAKDDIEMAKELDKFINANVG
jgi:hypothetical protein